MPNPNPIDILQRQLQFLGFNIAGDEIGKLGPSTALALKTVQERNHLAVTGKIDDQTVLAVWLEAVVVRTLADIELQNSIRDKLTQYLGKDEVKQLMQTPFNEGFNDAIDAVITGLISSLTSNIDNYLKIHKDELKQPIKDHLDTAVTTAITEVRSSLVSKLKDYFNVPSKEVWEPFLDFVTLAVDKALDDIKVNKTIEGRLATYLQQNDQQEALKGQIKESIATGVTGALTDFPAILEEKLPGLKDPMKKYVVDGLTQALDDYIGQLGQKGGSILHRIVSGTVRWDDRQPISGWLIRAYYVRNEISLRLGEDYTDDEGHYAIHYPMLPNIDKVDINIVAYDTQNMRPSVSKKVENAESLQIVDLIVPGIAQQPTHKTLNGRIIMEYGLPAEKITLRLYCRKFGGEVTKIAETNTLSGGRYVFDYPAGGRADSLEVRAVDGQGKEIVLSRPINDLEGKTRSTLNLVAPSKLQPLTAEYTRLCADLKSAVGARDATNGLPQLTGLVENSEHQDLTVLNRVTGWDARLIALAAKSEKLHADPEVNLPSDVLYALLRCGLPSDKLLLAQVNPDTAVKILTGARDKGLVDLTNDQIMEFWNHFKTFGNGLRLSLPIPGSSSTYGGMISALDKFGLDQNAQNTFADAYLSNSGSPAKLWDDLRGKLGDSQIATLQIQGKLAFLTGNSQAMTTHLLKKGEVSPGVLDLAQLNPAKLVDMDMYDAGKWQSEIRQAAKDGSVSLDDLIPSAYQAETVDNRLNAYAADMARKVRLSYPTHVIGRMLEADEADTFKLGESRASTAALLKKAAGLGFRLGQTPVEYFLKTHAIAGDGAQPLVENMSVLKQLQRVYQITPSNDSMRVLMSLGLDSAYAIMGFKEDAFVSLYTNKHAELYGAKNAVRHVVAGAVVLPVSSYSPRHEAHMVYSKARQVSSITYNLFTIARAISSTPAIPTISAPPQMREEIKDQLIKHFPTMQSLFGSMDFCECEHCRSVLSPAAYLVDLLQFIDVEKEVWHHFTDSWAESHSAAYPFGAPYEALVERRPDIPYIPLTCENTNTAMPYIDIVNEIFEYYVAHNTLSADAARDTGSAESADLLAEPQNVIGEAYDKLVQACYPITLPFDLWLETVRQFCDYFEIPLERILEAFRPGESLFAPTQPYDRAGICAEALDISPAEWAVFTDPASLISDGWKELYGYPATQPEIKNPTNAGQATLAVANSAAARFSVGDPCTCFSISANAPCGGILRIDQIGAPESGGAGQTKITFDGMWSVLPVAGDQLVMAAEEALKSAKTLAYRLGVTYQNVLDIIKTGFVNPKLNEMTVLYKTGISLHSVILYYNQGGKTLYDTNHDLLNQAREDLSPADRARYNKLSDDDWSVLKEMQAFIQKFDAFLNHYPITSAELEEKLRAIAIPSNNQTLDQILVLADPDTGCNFDLTTLRYASGRAADAIAFHKINLFVRLWRRLGWTIQETDQALQAFVPPGALFDAPDRTKQPLASVLVYLAHLNALNNKVNVGKQGRLKLVTLWKDIDTTGNTSLYAQLFLTRRALKSDDIFDQPFGDYLAPQWVADRSQAHVYTAQAASNDSLDPHIFAGNPNLTIWYDSLQQVQYLSYRGLLSNAGKEALNNLVVSPVLRDLLGKLLDAVQREGWEFSLIKGHLPALQGALGLTSAEIELILKEAGMKLDADDPEENISPGDPKMEPKPKPATLSLVNISLLYRYGLLAKALKLPVGDLIALEQLSGLNPFHLLQNGPLQTIDQDFPFTQTLRFVEVAGIVKDSGLSIEDLKYLLCHSFDAAGKYRPNPEAALAQFKTLSDGIRAIRAAHALPADASRLSEDSLRKELSLALTPDVVERLLGMVRGTAEFTAVRTDVPAADSLPAKAFTDETLIREVSYKEMPAGEQKLTLRGVLFDAEKDKLVERFRQYKPVPKDEQIKVFQYLLEQGQAQARVFYENHLMKQPLHYAGEAGFLDDETGETIYKFLFKPLKPYTQILPDDDPATVEKKLKENESIDQENQTDLQNRHYTIAKAYLPFLQQRLIRQFVLQTITTQTEADPALVESLVTDEQLLSFPAGGKPLLEVFTALEARGLRVEFRKTLDGSGQPDITGSLPDTDTTLASPQPPAGMNSACISGYLEVPAPGAYRFYVTFTDPAGEAELRFDHLPASTFNRASKDVAPVGDGPDEYVVLKPGLLYHFTLILRKLNQGSARMTVQGETLPKGPLAQLALYPENAIAGAQRAVILLGKTLQLLQALGINERAIRYLTSHAKEFDNLNLAQFPTLAVEDIPEKAQVLFKSFLRLAGYAALARSLAGGADDLIDVFEASGAGDIEKAYHLLGNILRRDPLEVKTAARALVASPAFPDETSIQRLWEVLQIVAVFGVPLASLLSWTRIVSSTVPSEQRFEIARDLRETIKARFEPESWQQVSQPIFDRLRKHQRDALVAYIMNQLGLTLPEQLFDHFLLDPGMEPVVQTSRIRLAISSVQMFVQRCLLNLEAKVHPTAIINASYWEWMKRYRVWEANRKIFLFPENWLEPEFRDDKTFLFAELEGKLLQGDVSNDMVEDAFLNYLKKMEDLAHLDIIAMHLEQKVDARQNTLHVFARTFQQPSQYFYRRYAQQMWTPWEPAPAEVEGDHLAPVFWRNRLYLFWVTFIDIPDPANVTTVSGGNENTLPTPTKHVGVNLHWSEYVKGEWSASASGNNAGANPNGSPDNKVLIIPVSTDVETNNKTLFVFDKSKVFIHVECQQDDPGVYIHLGGQVNHSFYLAGRNSSPVIVARTALPDLALSVSAPQDTKDVPQVTRYPFKDTLSVNFQVQESNDPTKNSSKTSYPILEKLGDFTLLPCNSAINPLTGVDPEDLDADKPGEVANLLNNCSNLAELARLAMPVFYQDADNVFYVEPEVTEQTVEEWEEYVTPNKPPKEKYPWDNIDWDQITNSYVPQPFPGPVNPGDPGPIENPEIDFESIYQKSASQDWTEQPGRVLEFAGELIGARGRTGMKILPGQEAQKAVQKGDVLMQISSGSQVGAGKSVVSTDKTAFGQSELKVSDMLDVVGEGGFNFASIGVQA